MWTLPEAHPQPQHLSTPWRYLIWLAKRQPGVLTIALLCGIITFVAQAVTPYAGGRAIDSGLNLGVTSDILLWAGAMFAATLIQVVFGAIGHRYDTYSWIRAALTTSQLLGKKVSHSGDAIREELPTGEVVASVATDAHRIGDLYFQAAQFVGSMAAYVVVGAVMLSTSPRLGLIIALGLPAVALVLAFLVKPLQKRQEQQREVTGRLTSLGSDTVSGLRILRGIGGESVFTGQYRKQSQTVRQAGNRVASLQSTMDGLQVLLPGIFVAIVLWVGATEAVKGNITAGQLVTFYGYATFLTRPMHHLIMAVQVATRSQVGASKVLKVLRVTHNVRDTGTRTHIDDNAVFLDHTSRVSLHPGKLTAVVCEDPDVSAQILTRMARLNDDTDANHLVTLADTPVQEFTKATLRDAVVLGDPHAHIFAGTLRETLRGKHERNDADIHAAIVSAACEDVLESVPDGLESPLPEKGRSLSGGQRQRVALARALLTRAPRLLLIEPTSAVDAHTEARIAARLADARGGRATLLTTASPLLLDFMDIIHVVDQQGQVIRSGSHHDLMTATDDGARSYQRTVHRELDSPVTDQV
ncbi:ABC transporter ATP-binding protein [Jonesia quinghaiensis]|uniref:ABC transporter ATP-binding protein n=1 Tax=Jonesia quinghaiensis TaxID=262806 RepID=UPI0003F5CBD8|nr:ABC transporter ATP-binding protein [Jonesia quinghaiensis]